MEKLADFTLVESIFKGYGISPNWLHGLANGLTQVYNNDTILNYYIENDICIISSGSINNKRYCKSILRDIRTLIKTHKKVIISSEVSSIAKFLSKYGFIRDESNNLYSRGV